ncbi:MAG: hypothetical protein KF810_23010 [Rhizobiaceae bacterium]|nr:hypothetical protein [Rhizobiaceae bacterium]
MSAKAREAVMSMEEPLAVIKDLANALALIAEAMGDDSPATTVQRLAWMVKDQVNEAEQLRGQLFHMTRPNGQRLAMGGRE